MDIQQISDSAKAIASDAQAIDLRFQASRDLKRRIAPIMASEAPFILLKTLLMIVFTSFPDPDEIAGRVDSGEIVSIDFMVRILTNIEECVEMITLRLATDSPDGECLHNFFNPLRLLDCRFLRSPLPAIEKHWSASSLAVEKLYRQVHTAAIANTTSIDISPLLTADYLQPPSFGMIRNWLRDVMVTKVAIAEDIEDASFSPLKMVLILPTAMIQAIVSGETVDFSAFPQTQVNFALTLAGALHKIGHWIRQNCFPSWNVPLSMMIAPLVQSQTSFIAKDPLTFRGGLLHWHNQSYVCATTLLSSIVPFGTLSLAQRNKSIVFDLKMSLRDIAGYFNRDCTEQNWVYLRHLPVPPIAANCYPASMSTIDADGLEADIPGDCGWNQESKGIAKKMPPIDITVAGYAITVKAKD